LVSNNSKPNSDPIDSSYDSRIPKNGFDSIEDAAKLAIDLADELPGGNIEFGGGIFESNGRFHLTEPLGVGKGTQFEASIGIPKGATLVGTFHLHPAGPLSEFFSSDDVSFSLNNGTKSFIGIIQNREIRQFIPGTSSVIDYSYSGRTQQNISSGELLCEKCF